MQNKQKKFAWATAGALVGAVLTLSISAVAEREATAPLPLSELRTFAEVFGRIKQDYVEPVQDKKLISDAINGMLSGLDPHSAYLDADAFKELREGTQGEFGGLGIEIGMEDGLVKVISPIEDTPAERAGLKSGDLISKIDETAVRGMTTTDAVKRMRGKPGTKIVLTVIRKSESRTFTVSLTRAVIKTRSVRFKLLESGYGYVRIAQFQERTVENLADGLASLYKENKADLKGLILDLRDDPGGLLNAAVGVSAAFLPRDTLVVYTEGRAPDSKMRLTTDPANYMRDERQADYFAKLPISLKGLPLVVLVNAGSASASEIVAGALQDHKRAVIVGTQSFGKGSVQSILPLGSVGGIKLTTAHYYTPSGRSIQAKGITPDVIVEDPPIARVDGQTTVASRMREADLEHHLNNPKDGSGKPTAPKAETEPRSKTSSEGKDKGSTEAFNPRDPNPKTDPQLGQALNILKVQRILESKKSASE